MNTTGKLIKISSDHDLWNEVIDLDQRFFPTPWKKNEWESLDLSQHGLWAYEDESRPFGFALFGTPSDETAHLLKILIIPERRGSGIASAFWVELIQELKKQNFLKVYLEVEESNERARSFYEKVGFHVLRKVKSYYSNGDTGIMMQLTL